MMMIKKKNKIEEKLSLSLYTSALHSLLLSVSIYHSRHIQTAYHPFIHLPCASPPPSDPSPVCRQQEAHRLHLCWLADSHSCGPAMEARLDTPRAALTADRCVASLSQQLGFRLYENHTRHAAGMIGDDGAEIWLHLHTHTGN